MDFRVGYGEDIHALVPNRKLVLSGTKIPFDLGLEGHSDADVVFHEKIPISVSFPWKAPEPFYPDLFL